MQCHIKCETQSRLWDTVEALLVSDLIHDKHDGGISMKAEAMTFLRQSI